MERTLCVYLQVVALNDLDFSVHRNHYCYSVINNNNNNNYNFLIFQNPYNIKIMTKFFCHFTFYYKC